MKNHFSFRNHLKTFLQTVKLIRNTALQITLTEPNCISPDLILGPLAPYPQPFQKHTLIINAQFSTNNESDYLEIKIIQLNSKTLVNLYHISTLEHLEDLRLDFRTYDDTTDPLIISIKYKSDVPSSTMYKLNYIYLECPYSLNKSCVSKWDKNEFLKDDINDIKLEIRPEKFLEIENLPKLETFFTKPIPWNLFGQIFIRICLQSNFDQNIQSLIFNIESNRLKYESIQLPTHIPISSKSLTILMKELKEGYDHYKKTENMFEEIKNRKHLLESKILRQNTSSRSSEELRAEMARNRDRLYQKYRSALKNKFNEILEMKKESQFLSTEEDKKKIGYIFTCYQQRIIKDLEQFQEARMDARPEAKLRIPRQDLDNCVRDYRIQKDKVKKAKEELDCQLMYVFQSWYMTLRMENNNLRE